MKTKKLNLLKVAAFGVLPVASGVALVSATSSVNSTNARSNNLDLLMKILKIELILHLKMTVEELAASTMLEEKTHW